MAILRLFKNHNILENNIVQTAASAEESLAAGVIFTFPALVLIGYWSDFNYLETVLIALCGGVLGVLFTVPLRSALIVEQKLQFPEGVATSEVLKTVESGGKAVRFILIGPLLGALAKLAESGLKLWSGTGASASLVGNKVYSWYIAIPWHIAANGLTTEGTTAVDLGYFEVQAAKSENAGLLFASGLITGEALIGILLAIPVAIWGSGDVMAIADDPFGSLPGIVVLGFICYLLYNTASKAFMSRE